MSDFAANKAQDATVIAQLESDRTEQAGEVTRLQGELTQSQGAPRARGRRPPQRADRPERPAHPLAGGGPHGPGLAGHRPAGPRHGAAHPPRGEERPREPHPRGQGGPRPRHPPRRPRRHGARREQPPRHGHDRPRHDRQGLPGPQVRGQLHGAGRPARVEGRGPGDPGDRPALLPGGHPGRGRGQPDRDRRHPLQPAVLGHRPDPRRDRGRAREVPPLDRALPPRADEPP
jgi:hypothetical protein